jgi:uncharacterized MnhB-related membrane protein
MDPTLPLLAIFSGIGVVFTYLAITERHLVRAVVYSAIQSVAVAFIFYLLRAPDIVLVYVPISVGIYPAAIFFLIRKTEEVEEP